jgi:hypothetical protein
MSKQYDVDKMNAEIDRQVQSHILDHGGLYSSVTISSGIRQKSDLSHLMGELTFLREEKKKLDKIEVIIMTPALVKDPASQPIPDWIAKMLRDIGKVLDGSDDK